MNDELTSLMHLDFFDGIERTSLAVHCWFEQVSQGEDPIYWLNELKLTASEINLYRGEWGNVWEKVDVENLLGE